MKAKRWIAISMALGLMLTSLAMVSAQSAEVDDAEGFSGTVSSYDEATGILVIDLQGGSETEPAQITFEVAPEVIRIPGETSAAEVAGTLEVGARVAVLAHQVEGEDRLVADILVVKPVRPIAPPVVGAVVGRSTDAEGNTVLTIATRNGTTKEITLPAGVGAPRDGDLVAAFARPDDERGGRPVLTGLAKADDVRARLLGHLAVVAANVDLPEQARARLTDSLANSLEGFVNTHVSILEEIRTRVPATAQGRIDAALSRAQNAREEARSRASEARENAGPPEGRGRPTQ
jgi:hypothetical protein